MLIVSLTSWKPRLKYVKQVIESILDNTILPDKILLILFKDDVKYIPFELNDFIQNNPIIELLVCDNDLGASKRWYYALQKYCNDDILLIDDDILYDKCFIERMKNYHYKYPNTVISNGGRPLLFDSFNKCHDFFSTRLVKEYFILKEDIKPNYFSHVLCGTGTLIPSNCLDIKNIDIDIVLKYKQIDEITLMHYFLINKIKTKVIPNEWLGGGTPINDDDCINSSLWNLNKVEGNSIMNNNIGYNDLISNFITEDMFNDTFNKIKFSIIIPIYNPNIEYFNRCIESIISQSIFNKGDYIEIIVVDDNSEDKSYIKDFREKYPFITFVENKENKGPGYSRNKGFDVAKNEIITWMDYDDYYIDNNSFLKIMQHFFWNPNLEILATAFVHCGYDIKGEIETYKGKIKTVIPFKGNIVAPQTKYYRRSFIEKHKLKYPDYRCAQDRHFFYDALLKTEFMMIYNIPTVFYNTDTENSISKSYTYKKLNDIIDSANALLKEFKKYRPNIEHIALSNIMNIIKRYKNTISTLTNIEKENVDKKMLNLLFYVNEHINLYKFNKNDYKHFIYTYFKDIIPVYKIDIVIPFVNGNDPVWKRQFNKYMKKFNPHHGDGSIYTRYDGNDILKYAFRSIDIYAPWVNKIHLLLSEPSQIPEWLDTNNEKIHIVYHKDFIPKGYLPCFNSSVIECWLWNIPGLSEKFIYANDDFIFNNNVLPIDFFNEDGVPKNNIQKTKYINPDMLNAAYMTTFMNASKLAAKGTNYNYMGFSYLYTPSHDIKSCDRKRFKEIFEMNKKQLLSSLSMFREERNVNIYFFLLYDLFRNKQLKCDRKYEYYAVTLKNMNNIKKSLKSNAQTLSLNDVIETTYVNKENLKHLLKNKFPNKCNYEK